MAAMNSQLSQHPVCSTVSAAGSTSPGTSGSEISSSNTSNSGSSSSSDDGFIQHFNWSTESQCRDKCVATLVQALLDDPVNQYLSGGHCATYVQREVLGYLQALPDASHFIATPDHQAVALWHLLPDETPRNEFWAGWQRIFKVPVKLWGVLLRMELEYEGQHAHIERTYGSYYYLPYIGTCAESRGKGYGSLLLKKMTDRADSEGRHCLLEATSPRSRALYERHGFSTFHEYRASAEAPPIFFMMRAPVPTSPPAAPVPTSPPAAPVPTSPPTPTTPPAAPCQLVLPEAGKAAGDAGVGGLDGAAVGEPAAAVLSVEQQQQLQDIAARSAAKVAAVLGPEAVVGAVGEEAIKAGRV